MKMQHAVFGVLTAALLVATTQVSAKKVPVPDPRQMRGAPLGTSLDHPRSDPPLGATAGADTTWLGSWTFDSGGTCNREGWTSTYMKAQGGPYFHVDDFAGLDGLQTHNLLYAPEGNQALWCGVRPDLLDPELCSYLTLPGYGNNWDQRFGTVDCLNVTGDVAIHFLSTWDSEPGYDMTCVQFDECDDNWVTRPVILTGYYGTCIDDWGEGAFTVTIPDSMHSSNVRVRFRFTSDGAWSDQDGFWYSDGAIVIDSLSVRDSGGDVIPTELFETESVGDIATADGNWEASIPPPYGDVADLFPGTSVLQENSECNPNLTCLWGFFAGSTYDYSCAGHPEQAVVPYGNTNGQYVNNEIWSPWIEITGTGDRFEFAYDRYKDFPTNALVAPTWHVRSLVDGCPDRWKESGIFYWPIGTGWERVVQAFGSLIEPGATHVQISLGVLDMCPWWCGSVGTGECHSHAPLYDNVTVYRINHVGPAWSVRDYNLFQDTFAADGSTTGRARIDAAVDILPMSNPAIRPGDSTVVLTNDPANGLASDPYTGFGSAVYMLLSVRNGGARPYSGDVLSDDTFRWPVVDSLLYGGHTWYTVRMDTSFTNGAARTGPQPDAFCVDLNDNLFVPGDTVFFAFAATSGGVGGATTYWTPDTGEADLLAAALGSPAECTILPAGGNILYVDGMNQRGSQPFFDAAFDALGITGDVDRYDIRAPVSLMGNRPGARVTDVSRQLAGYDVILWDTGNLSSGLIGDGLNEKSDDAAMLLSFLDGLQSAGGVYFSGDNIASVWQYLTGSAVTLKNTYMQHTLVDDDHQNVGLPLSPYLIATAGGCFDHATVPDTLVADGGCPLPISRFDVLAAAGASTVEMTYEGDPTKGAVVSQFTTNPSSVTAGVFLSGVSFYSLRNDGADLAGRADHLGDILSCLTGTPVSINGPVPGAAALSQNVPNPFNPTTAIDFTVRERARVTLRVYNVRGQLVRTLVDDTRAPGIVHHITWDGTNAAGQRVASGVYFYRMVTRDFRSTRKMVLLK